VKARRWSDTAAFRADPDAAPTVHPSRSQTLGLLVVLLLVAGAVVAVSYLVRPEKARAFDLVHGSVFLQDATAPVGIDLASGKPTVRLTNAVKQVGATKNNQLSVVPLDGATLLLNNGTDNANSGEFNEVDRTGFVVKPDGSGVLLSRRTDQPTAIGYDAGIANSAPGSAYIERTGPDRTDVFLISSVTVTRAAGSPTTVKPRASISLAAMGDARPGAGASANGDLWLVLKSGNNYSLSELRVPDSSKDGAELDNNSHGKVSVTAAIGVARDADSGSASVVGVAEPNKIALYRPGAAKPVPVKISVGSGVNAILPATNQGDQLGYLMHANDGWHVVSVRSDGTDRRQAALTGIPPDADLAQPTASASGLYTLDRSTGEIYEIVPGETTAQVTPIREYPEQTGEAASLGDAYLVGRGPRVIVNSPGHAEALVLFTDGSHRPLVVRKSTAVDIDAAATATTYTGNQTNQKTKPSGSSSGAPKSQPISSRVDCKTVNQKPHIPTITDATPGSRSVALGWTYPLLDQQDCAPSTYEVTVKVLSNDAPKPDGSVTVQGQQSVNLAGLYPSTRYQITVTAYLNKLHTSSRAVTVTTGPEGPAAPTGVTANADAAGNWTVRWSGCGDVAQGCVPAVSWRVIPSFCDGVGLSGAPTPLNVPADPSTKVQAPALYKGSDDLLGRGLQFQIEGTGSQGQAGAPSAKSGCVYSWAPPNVAGMRLDASTADSTELGGSTSANVTLRLGSDPTRNVGGYGAKITLTLSGNGMAQTKSFVFNGNQTTLSATFPGVRAGAIYTASATVTPAHGGSSATVAPVQVQTRANWPPNISMTANCSFSGLSCTPSIRISGISSADANNERFDLTVEISCGGGTGASFTKRGIDPSAGPFIGDALSQTGGYYGSNCGVTAKLLEDSDQRPLVFGGSPKTVSGKIDFGAKQVLNPSASDFSAIWNGSTVTVSYIGKEDVSALTTNWSATVEPPGGGSCQSGSSNSLPISIPVSVDCIQGGNGADGWQVALHYQDTVGGAGHDVNGVALGKAPTYQPPQCAPDTSAFSAQWGQTQADGISVGYTGTDDSIAGCGGSWSYTLVGGDGNQVCSGGTVTGTPPRSISIGYAGCATAPAADWKVQVTWNATNGAPPPFDIAVQGAVPPA
jgi:hypothetical protein